MRTQNTGPLVYVMTPVYNGETYLRECIESVLAQTYSNWVYTLVNNGSTDRTLEIAQEYAARDTRIRIHNNRSFLPVIDNHNLAYSLIPPESKYCKPLMADDLLFPECISEMVRVAEGNPTVGLVCSYWSDGTYEPWNGPQGLREFISGRDICRATLLDERSIELCRHVFGASTNQLIRTDLIRKREPFYNSSNIHSDFESCFDILQESDCGFVHRALAFFRLHENSVGSRFKVFETTALGNLTATVKYGPVYLTENEYQERLERAFGDYYRLLARTYLRGQEAEFWEFHRQRLQEIGYSLDEQKLSLAVTEESQWKERVDDAIEEISTVVPVTASFILVDEGEWGTTDFMAGRRRIPFLERNGEYWGRPADDATSIGELERLRQSGANYIVFAWSAFWWLDYYSGLNQYLQSKFRSVLKSQNVMIFDLGSDCGAVIGPD